MTKSEIAAEIRRVLADGTRFRYTPDLADDASLSSEGVADSFDMIDLVVHLEQSFSIQFAPDEINLDNLDSIAKLTHMVAAKLGPDGA